MKMGDKGKKGKRQAYMTMALVKRVIPGRWEALNVRFSASLQVSGLTISWWRRIRERAMGILVVSGGGGVFGCTWARENK